MKPGLRLIHTIAVVSAALSLAPSSALAETPDPAWEKFASARRVFQIRLCELATRRWPEYSSFFATHRDLQLGYIERRGLIFYRLMAENPSRIVRDQGGEVFLNFRWSEEEDKKFITSIPGYRDLSAEITRLKSAAGKFKKRAALQERFARLEIDPEYLALMREMSRSITLAEQEIHKAAAKSEPDPAAPSAPALPAPASPPPSAPAS